MRYKSSFYPYFRPNFRGLVFGLEIVPSEEEIDVDLADKFTVAMKEEFSITAAAKSVNGNLKDYFTIKEAIGDLNYIMVYAKGSSYLVFLEIN